MNRPIYTLRLLSLCCLISLTGCAVGPNYHPPISPLPNAFSEQKGSLNEIPDQWWTLFQDPTLNQLMARALTHNPDLIAANANIRAARAELGIASGGLLPQINASGRVGKDQISQNSEMLANLPPTLDPQTRFDNYHIGLDASWEIDLFGYNRRQREAAQAMLGGSIAQQQDTHLRISAEVARNAMDYRYLRQRLQLLQEQIKHGQAILALSEIQYQEGIIDLSALSNAKNALHQYQAAQPPIESAQYSLLAALSVLTDQPIETIKTALEHDNTPIVTPTIPNNTALPSTLLLRRPDVRFAERQLAAATAQVGVAIADQYPRLNLVGSGGWDSVIAGTFTERASQFWGIGPQIHLPLFTGGRLASRVKAQQARQEAALAHYRKAVLNAIADTETAFIRYQQENQRLNTLQQAYQTQRQQTQLATLRYQVGESPKTELLAAQQKQADLAQKAVESRQTSVENLILLIKSVGGGFTPAKTDNPK